MNLSKPRVSNSCELLGQRKNIEMYLGPYQIPIKGFFVKVVSDF